MSLILPREQLDFPLGTAEWPAYMEALPSGWKLCRAKWFLDRKRREPKPSDEIVTAFINGTVTLRNSVKTDGIKSSGKEFGYQRVERGDLVISGMNAHLGGLGVSDSTGKSTPVYLVYRPKGDDDVFFLAYLLRHLATSGYISSRINTIRFNSSDFNHSDIAELVLPLPPLLTQKAIANFLDRKTAAIDALIEKKQKLLKLLAEKRSALINQAVTKGLDPNVPMKDSGIPWISEIPAHWDVCSFKHLIGDPPNFGIQMGPFGSSLTTVLREPTPHLVFGQANTISGNFNEVSRWITSEQFCELEKYVARPGDIVLTRKGSIGNCRLIPDDVPQGIIDSDTIRVRLKPKYLLSEFVVSLLHRAKYLAEQLSSQSRGAIIPGLNTTVIGGLKLLVPPIPEQRLLQESIKVNEKMTAREKEALTKQLARLREYRQSLITAAVTGQLEIPAEDSEA